MTSSFAAAWQHDVFWVFACIAAVVALLGTMAFALAFRAVSGAGWPGPCDPTRDRQQRRDTKRRRAEEELRESEARMRALTDAARDAILMMDPQGIVSYWNPAAESIFGYTAKEAIGRNLHELLAPDLYSRRSPQGISGICAQRPR